MRRRDLLLAPLPASLAFGEDWKQPKEWVTAAASRDTAPRVGLIPSTFTGGEEMDGKKIRGLARPAPLGAELSAAQLDDMLRLAVELGGGRRGGLVTAIGREDWVAVKVAAGGAHPGENSDPRIVAGVLRYLLEQGLGKRFTIVDTALSAEYREMAAGFARKHAARFDVVETGSAPMLEMPVEGRVFAKQNRGGMYRIPRLLRECDKVISIAPLATRPRTGVALSMMNYLGFSPTAAERNAPGDPGEAAVDLFSFQPAAYAVVGGTLASESDGGAGSRPRRHNVIVAGTSAPAVDAVAAAVMGFESTSIRHLDLAVRQGYGLNDADSIWTRGSEAALVKAGFRQPPHA